jgi:hypothetical protein
MSHGRPLGSMDRQILRTWTSATLADSEAEDCERLAEAKKCPSQYLQ